MATRKQTFSRKVKDELCQVVCERDCCRRTEVAVAVLAGGRDTQDGTSLHFSHAGSASRIAGLMSSVYQYEPEWHAGRERVSLLIQDSWLIRTVDQDIQNVVKTDSEDCCSQAGLRALFLSGGRISEPSSAYHLEISVRRHEAAMLAIRLLEQFEIHAGILDRNGQDIVYLKEGQQIADFLLLTGAHQSLLMLESLRVEKEMRNSVNRVVNCDSANTQRIADTAARQIELISRLSDSNLLQMLPDKLIETAVARVEHPDLSLKELGEVLEPRLGKSGVNHRLKQIETRAASLLVKKESGHGT